MPQPPVTPDARPDDRSDADLGCRHAHAGPCGLRHAATSRRGLVGGVLGLGVGVPLLAACGAGGSESGDSSGSGDQADAPVAEGGVSAPTSEVPVGGGVILEDSEVVITQPAEGEFRAFGAVCPHQACLVSEVTEEGIGCTCHGSLFSLEDGSVLEGPADEGLSGLTASVEGSDVTVS